MYKGVCRAVGVNEPQPFSLTRNKKDEPILIKT